MTNLNHFKLLAFGTFLITSISMHGQEMRADKTGVKVSGQLVYNIENRTQAITEGNVFALSTDKKEILGYSETTSGPTFNRDPYRLGGQWLIEGLPYNKDIVLVGFAKNVKRLIWIKSINTGNNNTIKMGQNIASLTVPNISPAESFIPIVQVFFIAGWIGEFYETKKQVEFVDELVANILKMKESIKLSNATNRKLESDFINGLFFSEYSLPDPTFEIVTNKASNPNPIQITCKYQWNNKQIILLIMQSPEIWAGQLRMHSMIIGRKETGSVFQESLIVNGYKVFASGLNNSSTQAWVLLEDNFLAVITLVSGGDIKENLKVLNFKNFVPIYKKITSS
jgi:hypothetical protein